MCKFVWYGIVATWALLITFVLLVVVFVYFDPFW
jgi:hypothetical protein